MRFVNRFSMFGILLCSGSFYIVYNYSPLPINTSQSKDRKVHVFLTENKIYNPCKNKGKKYAFSSWKLLETLKPIVLAE